MSALPHDTISLQALLSQQHGIWRGDGLSLPALPGLATGFAALDALLPGGGWPVGALCEIFPTTEGIGEVSLVLPTLARTSQSRRDIAWVMPARTARNKPRDQRQAPLAQVPAPQPRSPFAPALAQAGIDLQHLLLIEPDTPQQALWALRQVIGSNAFAVVLAWLEAPDAHSLRRLQIAAETCHTAVLLFRPARCAHQASPAALKLQVSAHPSHARHLSISILKRRGAPLAQPVMLELSRPGGSASISILPASAHAMDRTSSPRPAGAGVLPC